MIHNKSHATSCNYQKDKVWMHIKSVMWQKALRLSRLMAEMKEIDMRKELSKSHSIA